MQRLSSCNDFLHATTFFMQRLSSCNDFLHATTFFMQRLSSCNDFLHATTFFMQRLSSCNDFLHATTFFMQRLSSCNDFLHATTSLNPTRWVQPTRRGSTDTMGFNRLGGVQPTRWGSTDTSISTDPSTFLREGTAIHRNPRGRLAKPAQPAGFSAGSTPPEAHPMLGFGAGVWLTGATKRMEVVQLSAKRFVTLEVAGR